MNFCLIKVYVIVEQDHFLADSLLTRLSCLHTMVCRTIDTKFGRMLKVKLSTSADHLVWLATSKILIITTCLTLC